MHSWTDIEEFGQAKKEMVMKLLLHNNMSKLLKLISINGKIEGENTKEVIK